MAEFKYKLEPYNGRATRHHCPSCKHAHTFSRYIDTDTGEYLASDVGKCNRADKCNYHYSPSQYFQDNPQKQVRYTPVIPRRILKPEMPREIGVIPKEYMIRSLSWESNFVFFLLSIFDAYTIESPIVERLMTDYLLGATTQKQVIFWQFDGKKIRTGKILQYDAKTGKRTKDIGWVHSRLIRDKVLPEDFNLSQTLYGSQLLNRYPDKTVCVVEAEKSAIIGSGAMPEHVWLATGGKQNLKADRCQILRGRKVILLPDLGAYDDWKEKGEKIASEVGINLTVSDLLEQHATATDREQGLDIADYLIRQLQSPVPEIAVSPFTDEEQALQLLGAKNPAVYSLIDALGLVSASTGEILRTHIN